MTLPSAFLQGPEILIFGGFIVLGLLIIIAALLADDASNKRYKRRINQVKVGRTKAAEETGNKVSARKRTSDSDIAILDRLIKSALPRREELRSRLARAGLEMTLGRYVSICAVCGIATFGLVAMTGMLPLIAAVFFGLVGAIGLPHVFISALAKRRQVKFIAHFPEAIDLMTRGIKSGLPISEAIKNAGEEIADHYIAHCLPEVEAHLAARV